MENENNNNKGHSRGEDSLEIGSAALTTAGVVSATTASAMAQEQQDETGGAGTGLFSSDFDSVTAN
jgi:hypothetical protein